MRSLLQQIRRRKVVETLVWYLLAAWLVIQVADVVGPALDLPDDIVRYLIYVAAAGLPIALGISWVYDVTPAGVTRTPRRHVARRLLVLPFRMLRPDADVEFLSFSLADAIASNLAGSDRLIVRPPLTAPSTEAGADIRKLAGAAEVDLVLTGTILREHDHLHVRTQLMNAPEATLVWSEDTTVPLSALFKLQTGIAERVRDSLSLKQTPAERKQVAAAAPRSARAYELYLRANQVALRSGKWGEAVELYRQALADDASFAPAWARLARCYRLIGKYALDPAVTDRELEEAKRCFERALELDPELPLTHSLYAQLEIDLGISEEALVRLLARAAVSGADAEIFAGLVQACRFTGLLNESVAAYERARELDPNVRTSVAHTYFMQGRYEAALNEYNNADIGYLEGACLAMLGRTEEAVVLLRSREVAQRNTVVGSYIASLRAVLEDRPTEALELMMEMGSFGRDGEAEFYMVRQLARIGLADQALERFGRVINHGFVCYPAFVSDPWLDPLRADARFQGLLRGAQTRSRQARSAFVSTGGEAVLRPA